MANIFNLTEAWKQIVDMSDQIDPETLADTLEAIEEEASVKVANMVAVVKNIKAEIEAAKQFKKEIEEKIRTMENNVKRINEYILMAVETIGKPKKDAPEFKKLEIKGAAWVKSVWTQPNPPSVEIIDERLIDPEFKIPQPDKIDTKAIIERWKQDREDFEARKQAYIQHLNEKVQAGEIDVEAAEEMLQQWIDKNEPKIEGVKIEQKIGVRYR